MSSGWPLVVHGQAIGQAQYYPTPAAQLYPNCTSVMARQFFHLFEY